MLVLAPRDPYPVIGGDRIRIHRLIRELAPYHDFTLVTFCRSRRERDVPPPADGLFKAVHRIVLPYWRSFTNTLGALATGEPLQVAFYRSASSVRRSKRSRHHMTPSWHISSARRNTRVTCRCFASSR